MGSATTRQFEVPTRDGKAVLRGQLDFPESSGPYPLLVIINGGWFMERDGYMGNSDSEADFMYRRIAEAANRTGLATLRYDNRGVLANELTMLPPLEGLSELDITKHYVANCIDLTVRREVTVQSTLDDIAQIFALGATQEEVAQDRIVALAHSEGGLNLARLIDQEIVNPRGVVFVGTITESPASILRWQTVERYVETILGWVSEGLVVTQQDVDRNYDTSSFPQVGIPKEKLAAPEGGWNASRLRRLFEEDYQELKKEALEADSTAPYPKPHEDSELVCASYDWWKQWFADETSVIDYLGHFEGTVVFHFGELDSQAPGDREAEFARAHAKNPPRLVVHEGRGHALRTGEPTAGPIDQEAVESLIADVKKMVQRD